MSKEIIIALMRDKPKHYSKMIQCNPALKSWVIDNAIIKPDNFAELIYSAIHPEINPICDLGNKKLFKGMTDGYSFCGTGGKCACLQELQRNNTTELKAGRTSEQRIAEIEKVKQTNLHRYGVENPAQSKEVYAKIKATNLEKYGVESPLQNAQVLEKSKNTNLERYGVEWSQQNKDVREKSKNTMVARYGTEHALQVPEFLKKAGDTCFENHGVRIPALSDAIVKRMIKTNLERYGEVSPSLNSTIFDKGIQTNLERYGVESKKQIAYSDELLELIESKELLTEMIKTHTVLDISIKYNVTLTTIYKYLKKHDVSLPVGDKTKFEKDVYAFVEENYDGVIHSTDKTVLKRKHLDIYLPELNLAIECNGTYWHSEMRNRGKEYHVGKTNECLAKGISLIHVWEHDWSAKQEIIKSMILHRLGKSKSVFARHTIVNKISSEIANAFYDKNHLQGKCLASIHLGLYHNNELISCMSFGQSRFNKKYEYELIRYANKTNHTVVGGASKLFKYFVKTYDPRSIISYAAKGHTTGNVYLQLGMVHTGVSTPSYSYTRDFVNIYNRQKFQKHKLENLLETFDPNKTEKVNMLINGYTRLWDSGNDIFVWDNS